MYRKNNRNGAMDTYPFLQGQSHNTNGKQEEEGECEPKSNLPTEDRGSTGDLGTCEEEPRLGRKGRLILHRGKAGRAKQQAKWERVRGTGWCNMWNW